MQMLDHLDDPWHFASKRPTKFDSILNIFFLFQEPGNDTDSAWTLLFTLDPSAANSSGVIFGAKNPDKLGKPRKGFPYLKYLLLRSS